MRANYYLQFFDDVIKGEFYPEKLLQLSRDQLVSRIMAHQKESDLIIHKVMHISFAKQKEGEIRILKQSSNIFPYPIKTSSFPKTELDAADKYAILNFINIPASSISVKEVKEALDESVVILSFPLDLDVLNVNQLAYFYLNLSLKTQIEDIKENLRLLVFEEASNNQSPKSIIGYNLELIIHNIAIFYRRLDSSAYYARTELPINPDIQDFFTLAGLYCEKVQRFLYHHFGPYIDREKFTNPLRIDSTLEQNIASIKMICDALNTVDDPINVSPELHKHLNELKYSRATPAISYNHLSFLVYLINRLHEYFQNQTVTSTANISFIELLIDCNLNTSSIINSVNRFLDSEIAQKASVELKIDYLRLFIKICNQRSLLQHQKYNSKFPDLSDALIQWCQATIVYLKKCPSYVSSKKAGGKRIPVQRKIRVNMNVTEIAGWCKFLVLSGMVRAADMTLVIEYLSKVLIPSDLDELKKSSLTTRYREDIKPKTEEAITGRLALFRKNLRSQ